MKAALIYAMLLVLSAGSAMAAPTTSQAAVPTQPTHTYPATVGSSTASSFQPLSSSQQAPVATYNHAPVSSTGSAAPVATGTSAASPVRNTLETSPVVSAPVAPAPTEQKDASGTAKKSSGWKFWQSDDSATPVPAAISTPAHSTVTAPATASGSSFKAVQPEAPSNKNDPEALLRGQVWNSESACKKEALKGSCVMVDCATHSGGACSGYNSAIWIYR